MSENMLDVLLYLFDNYWDVETINPQEEDVLATELEQAGFRSGEIDKAFDWIEQLAELQTLTPPVWETFHPTSVRIFAQEERRMIDADALNLILALEHDGILDSWTREIIMDRALAIDSQLIGIEEMQQIIDLVLLNQPESASAMAWEDLTSSLRVSERLVH